MTKKKRYRKKKKTMREKAESFSTWFDYQRAHFVKNNDTAETVGEALSNFKDFTRRVLMAKATEMTMKHMTPYTAEQLSTMNEDEVERINRQLGIPLPKGDPIEAVCNLLLENKHFLEGVKKGDWKNLGCLLSYLDIMGTVLGMESVMAENSELMIMDSGLVAKVLKSKNEPISGDDLEYVPFNTMTIEFSNPVPLVGDIKASAVSFVARKRLRLRSVIWHFDNMYAFNGSFGMRSMMIDMHVGDWAKFVIDDEARRLAGLPIPPGDFPTSASFGLRRELDLADETLEDSDSEYMKFFKEMQVNSRNIWDFVTCRNIDYEECPRKSIPGRPRPKHVQAKEEYSPRKFRIIKVNKRVKKGGGGAPIPTNMENSVNIPAMFHYWVYCLDCGRVHRKDLVGRPCRRCKLAVGPMSNMDVKKHWHEGYRLGEGLLEDTVWGVRER